MAILQFFVSIMITWSVLSAFSSDFLSEYETIKMTSIIIIGGAPFNITILVWVALKLETYRLMKKRYGKEFKDDTFFQKIEAIERNENESIKEGIKEKKTKDKDGLDFASTWQREYTKGQQMKKNDLLLLYLAMLGLGVIVFALMYELYEMYEIYARYL